MRPALFLAQVRRWVDAQGFSAKENAVTTILGVSVEVLLTDNRPITQEGLEEVFDSIVQSSQEGGGVTVIEFQSHTWPNNESVPGTYRVTQVTEIQTSVAVSCPKCGKIQVLRDHHVDDDGHVRPAVNCADCGSGDYAKLVGWSPSQGSVIGYRPSQQGSRPVNG